MAPAGTLRVIEPATEAILAEVPEATAADVDLAVASARSATTAWRSVDPTTRGRILARIGDLITEHLEDLARLESRNVGKPIADAKGEMEVVAHTFHYYAGAPERLLGQSIPVADGIDVTFREPLGVVGIIVPWNFPLPLAAWKVAPALAAGNTVVLKPSELTPLTALELRRLSEEAGLPEGVFHVLPGYGQSAGERLVTHPDVAKIAFTGSTTVGKRIHELASSSLKRVTLELGGKSANIVFADANLASAAKAAPLAVFGNSGQDCCARSRILVERSCLEAFLELFIEETGRLRIGDPLDESTQLGPLISAKQRDRVAGYLEGVTPTFRATAPEAPGFWFPPTIVCPTDPTERLAQDEIFGPVAAIIPFDTEAEAVEIANRTRYGLSGSIWTRDIGRAFRVARNLDSGTLSVNSNTSVRVSTPFGGFKESGIGRELGPDALESYTEVKNVFVAST